MSFPGAVSSSASTTLVLALLLPAPARGDEHPYRTQALAGAYRYDATPPKPAPTVEAATPVEPAGRPRKRVTNPAERLAGEIPLGAPAGSAALAPDGTLMLPKMTVPGKKPKLPPPLPQLHVPPAVRDVGPGDEYETPAARSRRLAKKYYTPASQKLNKVLLNSVPAWAVRDAAIADSSEQLNDLAYLIELSLATGTETAEEQKKIRAEYFKVLAEKPR